MTETKTVNWKEIAENSDNPEIKEKYELFKTETDPQKQRSLRGLIVALIKTDAAQKAAEKETGPENVQPEPESGPENVQQDKPIDPDGLSDVEKLRFWKDRIVVLENSRLKNETYAQRRELNKKIFEANEQIAKLREKIRNDKRAKKLEEIKRTGRVSSLASRKVFHSQT